jgi:hypothetical protein
MSKNRFFSFGRGGPTSYFIHACLAAQRAPTINDTNYDLGQPWEYQNILYFYAGAGIWVSGNGAGNFTSLTVTGQSTLAATNIVGATNINTSGAAITNVGTGGTGAVNIGNATGNTAITGNESVSGNLSLTGATSKLLINATTAATASVGVTAAMTTGAVTVTSSAVTTASIINYSRATGGGTLGNVEISAQSAGSFTLTSSSNSETSTFNYQIIN